MHSHIAVGRTCRMFSEGVQTFEMRLCYKKALLILTFREYMIRFSKHFLKI